MSYVEHGPRIFLAGRPNNMPLTYGDYVLPKKRLEGRLKVYDSCSDIRAWSPNPLESSQYFRELAEHAPPPGKIIPFNVVIENIIGLTSQAQNELQILRQELKKYKSLKLTPEQEQYLATLDDPIVSDRSKEKQHKNNDIEKHLFEKEGSKVLTKSTSLSHLDSYFSIQINPEKNVYYNDKNYPNLPLFSHIDLASYRNAYLLPKLRPIYVSPKIENAKKNKYRGIESDFTNLEDKHTQVACAEYTDICIQVIWDKRDIGIQTDYLMEYNASSIDSQVSICKYNNDSRSHMKKNLSVESFTETEFETSSIVESDLDIEIHERSHKDIIIQKDSEIIALKNELGVKEAEIEELKEVNKNLEIMLKRKDENLNNLQGGLKIVQKRLMKVNEQQNNELEDMAKKLYTNKCIIDQLKTELNKKLEESFLQSQEIDKLRSHVKETASLLLERDSLVVEKVKEMERLSKEADNCRGALDQLKEALHEKDELQKQNQEQDCMLADQECEIKRLLILIQQMSSSHNDQKHRMTTVIEELEAKIIDKDNTISKYEEQLHCMEEDIHDFTIKLKNDLNNLEEFKFASKDIYSRVKCEHDTCKRTKHSLCTVSALVKGLQKSKIEDKESFQQIRNFTNYTEKSVSVFNMNDYYNSSSSISEVDELTNAVMGKKVQTLQKYRQGNTPFDYLDNKMIHEYIDIENQSNKDVSESESWNSAKTEVSILAFSNNINAETTMVEEVSRSLTRMQCLMDQLQIYVEKERPSLIKQIHSLYKDLVKSKSLIAWLPDTNISKQEMCDLYNKYKKEYENNKFYVTDLNKDLQGTLITEDFIKVILHLQLQDMIVHDEHIDRMFSIQIKHSISKMKELFMALQGAGDQRVKIVKEVEKKRQEILEKDSEIARLKEKVQRGEGDCIRPEQSEWNIIKDNFKTLDIELNQKNQLIEELRDELQLNNLNLSMYIKECNELKQKNKSLVDTTNVLVKECDIKNNEIKEKHDEINTLVQQIQNLDKSIQITNNMEKEIEELRIKLNFLQEENVVFKKKLGNANDVIWKNNNLIRDLKDKKEQNKHIFALKCVEYDKLLAERENVINKLENENLCINEKLIDTEYKVLLLNNIISLLREQDNETKILNILQVDSNKYENEIKTLKMKSFKYKLELLNYENTNKENETRLAAFTKENIIIRKDIEMLKNKLSVELAQESVDKSDELKFKIHDLSNEIYNKIINLKNQVSKPKIHHPMHLKSGYEDLDKDFEDEKDTSKQLENENAEEQSSKIKHLIKEVANKDLEIEKLKNHVNYLSKENDDLHKKLKSHKESYENKLTILKKKYDSSISALHKKHKENIEHLKMNFEEINGEKVIFDSESWLQSLSVKELRDVCNRIFLLMNKLNINNNNKDILNLTDKEELCQTMQNIANEYDNNEKGDALWDMQHNQMGLQEKKAHITEIQNVKLKSQNDLPNLLLPKYCLQNPKENKSKESNMLHNIISEKRPLFDSTSYDTDIKYDPNSRFYNNNNNQKYSSKDATSVAITKTVRTKTADLQRKNFIYQCSIYHKKSNTCKKK